MLPKGTPLLVHSSDAFNMLYGAEQGYWQTGSPIIHAQKSRLTLSLRCDNTVKSQRVPIMEGPEFTSRGNLEVGITVPDRPLLRP